MRARMSVRYGTVRYGSSTLSSTMVKNITHCVIGSVMPLPAIDPAVSNNGILLDLCYPVLH
jgi:hypothetical protein